MKSERLVSLMLLLQGRSRRSARELAQALEVSMRTIYRDVEALGSAGVPVYAERGSNGGIVLAGGYRQAIAQFSSDELHALFAAASDPLSDLGVHAHERALHKLEGALPDLQRRAAQKARQRVLLDHNRWYRSRQPSEVLAALRRAVWEDRKVELRYRDRTGAETTRVIDPLGLVSKAGVWYAIAREPGGDLRTFRAERILAAVESPQHFERPDGFDLEAYWNTTQQTMKMPEEPYDVTLAVQSEWLEMVLSYWQNAAVVLAQDDFGKTLRITFPSDKVALGQVAGWGARVRVLEPAELRASVLEHARAILQSYEEAL